MHDCRTPPLSCTCAETRSIAHEMSHVRCRVSCFVSLFATFAGTPSSAFADADHQPHFAMRKMWRRAIGLPSTASGLRQGRDFINPGVVEKALAEVPEVTDVSVCGLPAASGVPREELDARRRFVVRTAGEPRKPRSACSSRLSSPPAPRPASPILDSSVPMPYKRRPLWSRSRPAAPLRRCCSSAPS